MPRPRAASELGRLVRVSSEDNDIKLSFQDDWSSKKPISIPHIWLRDLCQCAHCVNESSGQKRFATCDIDAHPKLDSCTIRDDGALEVVWADDFMARNPERGQGRGEPAHTSVYPLDLLHGLFVHGMIPEIPVPERIVWDRAIFQSDMTSRTVSYEDWMAGGPVFAKAMLALAQWGLVIVKGVPTSKTAVKSIANQIGELQSTFYGLTWDVISKPQAENVAYTNEFLCLHQDLMYWNDPPKIQLLHCLANECAGGDSLFSDGFRAAVEFKIRRPEQWDILRLKRVLFHYARNGNFYRRERTVIKQKGRFIPDSIHWSPPFQGPFPPNANRGDKFNKHLPAWRDAAEAFRDSLEAPENMLQYRLQPGDCVLFDNHRVLHGRTQFDVSAGHRHLHGTYIDAQTMKSALARLVQQGHLDPGDSYEAARSREEARVMQMYGVGKESDHQAL